MDKIVVVGGLGYVGGRISNYLSNTGRWEIVATTRCKGETITGWLNGSVVNADLGDVDGLATIFKDSHAVIHLAAMNEIDSAKDPLGAAEVNVRGTISVLKAAIQANVNRFIYFSTAHVYGSPLKGDLEESVLPKPVHPYAISHHNAEDWVLAAHSRQLIDGIVVRLSNSIGPPASLHADRWTLLVNDLCKQAVTLGALTLRSAGRDLRNFITLDDVARAADHLLGVSVSELQNGLFNLGGGLTCSVLEMAERIASIGKKVLGKEVPICRPDEFFEESIPGLNYDWGKLAATGFRPRCDYDAEISDTLKFCLDHFRDRS